MGEMELHVMAQRLQANKRAAAGRGELRTPLPVGLVHDDAGDIVIDPDAEVQAAIRDVFAAFTASGSAYGVVAAFAGRRFPLRAYGGAWAGQLRWGRLAHARVLGILKNRVTPGRTCSGRYNLPPHRRPVRHGAYRDHRTAPRRLAGADQRPPRGLHHLGGVPGQPGRLTANHNRRRRPAATGGHRAVPGNHQLRQLRQADDDQLPHRSAALL